MAGALPSTRDVGSARRPGAIEELLGIDHRDVVEVVEVVVLAGLAVRVGLARVGGANGERRDLHVGPAHAFERLVATGRVLGDHVDDELEGQREPHPVWRPTAVRSTPRALASAVAEPWARPAQPSTVSNTVACAEVRA